MLLNNYQIFLRHCCLLDLVPPTESKLTDEDEEVDEVQEDVEKKIAGNVGEIITSYSVLELC